jgi:hypothetical protein
MNQLPKFLKPGTDTIQNAGATNVALDTRTRQRIEAVAKPGLAEGATLLPEACI